MDAALPRLGDGPADRRPGAAAHPFPGSACSGTFRKGRASATAAQLPVLLEGLRAAAGSAFAIKVEPEIEQSAAAVTALRGMGLEKSRHDVQISRATIIVDLRPG